MHFHFWTIYSILCSNGSSYGWFFCKRMYTSAHIKSTLIEKNYRIKNWFTVALFYQLLDYLFARIPIIQLIWLLQIYWWHKRILPCIKKLKLYWAGHNLSIYMKLIESNRMRKNTIHRILRREFSRRSNKIWNSSWKSIKLWILHK